MSMHSKIAIFGAAGLLLAVLPATAKPKAMPKTPVLQTAVIENTGSTNTFGYTVTVSLTGNSYHVASVSNNGNIRNSETGNHENLRLEVKRFFSDLDAAMPLTSLPTRHGMRSASFGTRTTITYKGQMSPDLTFASDPRTTALKADIAAMTSIVHAADMPKHPIVVIHADR